MDDSDIEWTDATGQLVKGCREKGEGCRNCYAKGLAATRLRNNPRYKGLAVLSANGRPQWTGEYRVDDEAIDQCLRWTRARRIFVTSMGDPFYSPMSDADIIRWLACVVATPQHQWQSLTKDTERMHAFFRDVDPRRVSEAAKALLESSGVAGRRSKRTWLEHCDRLARFRAWPIPNLLLGASVENAETVDERLPWLNATPAAGRFVSAEPLLGPLAHELAPYLGARGITWAIAGFESGLRARPGNPEWIYDFLAVCRARGVAPFFKQWGEFAQVSPADGAPGDVWVLGDSERVPFTQDWQRGDVGGLAGTKGRTHNDVLVRRVGKRAAGALVEGVKVQEFPAWEPWV